MDALELVPAHPSTSVPMKLRVTGSLFLALGFILSTSTAIAAQDPPLEYRVKAAFLLNFTRFVEWPPYVFANDRTPVSICILGVDPFGAVMDDLVNDQFVNSRKLIIHRIQELPSPGSCQVLFFEKTDEEVPALLARTGPGVLTVGQGEQFLRDGGIIAFVLENRRVRFDINENAAIRAELKMNAKLLSVARAVER
jgi:hypothetical protein